MPCGCSRPWERSLADGQSTAPGSVDPALDALALARFNHNASFDKIQPSIQGGTRCRPATTCRLGPLRPADCVGRTDSGEADGMSLGEIAAAKFVKDQTQNEK
jgi:hypothetical protein